jgi:norsolorinic acid ketoreductase
MASTTNVLITGANRGRCNQHTGTTKTLTFAGLGKAFLEQYLSQPNHIVIGAVRDVEKASGLRSLPTALGTKLILVQIEYISTTDAFDAVKELKSTGITKIDIVIANAGISGQQGPMETIDPEGLAQVYLINSVGPAILFIALKPLLDEATNPKWMSISTGLASIQNMEEYPNFKGFPYNASKTALNYFTKAIHFENPEIVAFTISPG